MVIGRQMALFAIGYYDLGLYYYFLSYYSTLGHGHYQKCCPWPPKHDFGEIDRMVHSPTNFGLPSVRCPPIYEKVVDTYFHYKTESVYREGPILLYTNYISDL